MQDTKQPPTAWSNKKIGVWGFGKVGKSVTRFFLKKNVTLEILDSRILNKREKAYIDRHHITIASQKEQFLTHNDILIASPGITLQSLYHNYEPKWLSELDLFAQVFHKKIISITGTVGKTSITTLLSDILSALGIIIGTGGNIGIPCLTLVGKQKKLEYAVLEVSSAQLAYTRLFTPDIAVITNISPNHLDWHGTLQEYTRAKCAPLFRQKSHQRALMPLSLKQWVYKLGKPTGVCSFFSDRYPDEHEITCIGAEESLFYITKDTNAFRAGSIMVYHQGIHKKLISLDQLPPITFDNNWVVLCAILYHLGIQPAEKLIPIAHQLVVPEHRLEKCAVYNGVTIYNDSKSTTTLSTQAAVQQLQEHAVILLLGGLSKGVDRSGFIAWLAHKVKMVCTFGSESAQLAQWCRENKIPVIQQDTVAEVMHTSIQNAIPGDCILFSPSGSSYDQFKDYQQRGRYFKKVVHSYVI